MRVNAQARAYYWAALDTSRMRARAWIQQRTPEQVARDAAGATRRRSQYKTQDSRRYAQWAEANPERARANAKLQEQRRRARIARVLATLTAAEWEAILEAAGRACIYCGSQTRLTQDHLTPISRGGPHTAENVAPACLPCNQSKGAKAVAEFLSEASQ